MKKLLYFFLLIVSIQFNAQTLPSPQYVNAVGTPSTETCYDMFLDQFGNLYATGEVYASADFDPSASTAILANNGSTDVYIAKYNSSGQYQWAINIGGASGGEVGRGICVDSLGNVYIIGDFGGTIDCDPGPGTANITAAPGNTDAFVAKYNSSGQYQWAFAIGNTQQDRGFSIRADSLNNIYIYGEFNGTVDFDPSPSTATLTATTTFAADRYLAKYNTNGQYQWAFNLKCSNNGFHGLAVDKNGDSYITGSFGGPVDFDPSASVATLTNSNGGFIAKYNSNGQYVWAYGMGTTSPNYPIFYSLNIDKNYVYVTGLFFGTVDFDPGPSVKNISAVQSSYADIIVLKYDKNCQYQWGFNIHAPSSNDYAMDIYPDANGNVYLCGILQGFTDFDPSASTVYVSPVMGQDAFLAKYDPSGNYIAAFQIGGAGASPYSDASYAIRADQYENIYITGVFNDGSVDFDPNSPVVNEPYQANRDLFFAKYACAPAYTPTNTTIISNLCSGTQATVTVAGSGNITWHPTSVSPGVLGTGTVYVSPTLTTGVSPSTYTYYAQAKTCTVNPIRASVVVTVNPLPNVFASTSNSVLCTLPVQQTATLTASGANTYSWNTSATTNSIAVSPSITTNYTVTGTDVNGCTKKIVLTQSVSACTGVDGQIILTDLISVYPNPNNGSFNLKLDLEIENGELILFNSIGQKVFSQKIKQSENEIKTPGLAKGLYHYSILQNKTLLQTGKIVIE